MAKNRNEGRTVEVIAQSASCRGPKVFEAVNTLLAMPLTSGYTSGKIRTDSPRMRNAQKRYLSAYRRRLKRQGMVRVEVQVRKDDAALLRGIAKALTDPAREAGTRALLRERFGTADAIGLKALLAAAPLDGIDLSRERDLDRDVIV